MSSTFEDRPPDRANSAVSLKELIEAHRDPHGLYDRVRSQNRVAYDPAIQGWIVTGHERVREFLADSRFVADMSLAVPGMATNVRRTFASDAIQRQVIFAEGPRQARIQKAVLTELSRRSASLEPHFRTCARSLADQANARGVFDLVQDFAMPFTLDAIARIMGVEIESSSEMNDLATWSTSYANITSGYLHAKMEEVVRLGDFFRNEVRARKRVPSDDLIGAFMRDGGLEDEDDLVIQCMMAFAAGRVTTQKALADGIPVLIPDWGEWRTTIKANPGALRLLVDELLRFVTPTRYVVRFSAEDVPLRTSSGDDVVIRRGQRTFLVLEAANRDDHAFVQPHILDYTRRPNPHVTFGFGGHRCPGASIARVEIAVAIEALLATLPDLSPDPDAGPTWDPNTNIGGHTHFPCICG